jgi:cysteine desulfurase family protein (TIGR01976 family)
MPRATGRGAAYTAAMSTSTSPAVIDRAAFRAWFPALASDTVFLENAGGSQVPGVVADAMATYMTSCYVQLGAGYPESDQADAVVDGAHAFAERLMGGETAGRAALGPSTSQLVAMLAGSLAPRLGPGDEIVAMEAGHEANLGPWVRLAESTGATLRWWKVDPSTGESSLEDLAALLGPSTRVVAAVHVSNLMGHALDAKALADVVHAHSSARVVLDGVAFAPHRAVDVEAWGVDWYVDSTYKVYGPHMAMLWGRHEAWAELTSPYHFFTHDEAVPHPFEVGGANHEGCAGLLALAPYLAEVASLGRGHAPGGPPAERLTVPQLLEAAGALTRGDITDAFACMEAAERPLQQRLLEWLASRPEARVIGRAVDGPERVPTIAFVVPGRRSSELASAAHAAGVALRHGHNYAHRLATAMGLDTDEGPVRVSAVHYNTPEEIERAITALDAAF